MKDNKEKLPSAILNKQLNVSAILISAVLIFILVKLLTFLPERYYFGFSKVVESTSSTAFLVSPPHVNLEKYEKILTENNYLEGGYYDGSQEEVEGANVDPEKSIQAINKKIIESGSYNFWISLILKILPPFIVGYFLFFVWRADAIATIPIGAAVTAFLLCWPLIVLWDRVVYGAWYEQKHLFFILYISYVLIYYNMARLGCILGKFSLDAGFAKSGKFEIDWGKAFSSLLTTGVTVTITWIVTTTIARA